MEHMTTEEVAKYLKVHPNTVKRYVKDEGLPVLRFPGKRSKLIFRKDLVDAWVYEMSQPRVYVKGREVKYDEKASTNKIRVMLPNR